MDVAIYSGLLTGVRVSNRGRNITSEVFMLLMDMSNNIIVIKNGLNPQKKVNTGFTGAFYTRILQLRYFVDKALLIPLTLTNRFLSKALFRYFKYSMLVAC